MNNRRGKIILSISGVVFLIAGVFIGGFLVLKSETSEGQVQWSENIDSIPYQSSTNEILKELDFISGSEKNSSTDSFLFFLSEKIASGEINKENLESKEIMEEISPLLEKEIQSIFPEIKDKDLNLQILADKKTYVKKITKEVLVLLGAWQETLMVSDPLSVTLKERGRLENVVKLVQAGDEASRKLEVPVEYVEFHKKLLVFSSAIQAFIESGFLKKEEDNVRGILVIAAADKIQDLGIEITNYFRDIKKSLE